MSKKETAIGLSLMALMGTLLVILSIVSYIAIPLVLIFVVLKLMSVILWPWFWVVSPVVFDVAGWVLLGIMGLSFFIWVNS